MPAWHLFGLTFAADRPVSGLEGCLIEGPTTPDVVIVEAPLTMPAPAAVDDWIGIAPHPGGVTLQVEGVARYRVDAGRHITIDRFPGVSDREVDIYLTGTVLGTLLHQRGLLPLHCNAVRIGGMAFLFCGDSGAGKSTLAAWFEARGHRLLTDDLCAVQVGGGQPLALPGIPRLRLWRQSLDLLARPVDGLAAMPGEDDKFEAHMALAPPAEPLAIGAIYHLCGAHAAVDQDARGLIAPLSGLAAVEVATANIYRRRIADHVGRTRGYLADAIALVQQVPVFAFQRNWGLSRFESEAFQVEFHATALSTSRNCEMPMPGNEVEAVNE